MKIKPLQPKYRSTTEARRGMERMLKEAAVSWKAKALPHLSGLIARVRIGIALGRYRPAPIPMARVNELMRIYEVAKGRQNMATARTEKPRRMDLLKPILTVSHPDTSRERVYPREREKNMLPARAWLMPKSCSKMGRRGERTVREEKLRNQRNQNTNRSNSVMISGWWG
jgi:hypothetical protein